jgi:hypothetical protein
MLCCSDGCGVRGDVLIKYSSLIEGSNDVIDSTSCTWLLLSAKNFGLILSARNFRLLLLPR